MSNIRVDLDYPIYDGANVTFKAPCDCTGAEGLTVYYPGGSKNFVLCDAHGVNISGIGDVFMKGVPVKAILDVTNAKAFIQNGDNNSFLARMLGRISDSQHVAYGSYVGVGGDPGDGYAVTLNFDFSPKFVLVYAVHIWEQYNEDEEGNSWTQTYSNEDSAFFIRGSDRGIWSRSARLSDHVAVSWGDTSVSYGNRYYFPEEWDESYGGDPYNEYDYLNLDNEGVTYHYVAIG